MTKYYKCENVKLKFQELIMLPPRNVLWNHLDTSVVHITWAINCAISRKFPIAFFTVVSPMESVLCGDVHLEGIAY